MRFQLQMSSYPGALRTGCGLSASDIGQSISLVRHEMSNYWRGLKTKKMKKPFGHCSRFMESVRKSLPAFSSSPTDGRISFPSIHGRGDSFRILSRGGSLFFSPYGGIAQQHLFYANAERLDCIGKQLHSFQDDMVYFWQIRSLAYEYQYRIYHRSTIWKREGPRSEKSSEKELDIPFYDKELIAISARKAA